MRFERQQLYLMLAGGLPRSAVATAAGECAGDAPWDAPRALAALQGRAVAAARAVAGRRWRGAVRWPRPEAVDALAERLRQARVELLWRGDAGYPARLAEGLEAPPPWVWVAGERRRLAGPACAVVGSRRAGPRFLKAAAALGRALADAGVTVVSGLAAGADTAAHEGAAGGAAGTVAAPARGVLGVNLSEARRGRAMTVLGLDRPDEPFSAGLAIRRNDVIAALSDGLALVASDLTGGSSYAVRWALAHGRPVWCFEAGRATPPGNRSLLRAGQARPLSLNAPPSIWAESIASDIRGRGAQPTGVAGPSQLDWLGGRGAQFVA